MKRIHPDAMRPTLPIMQRRSISTFAVLLFGIAAYLDAATAICGEPPPLAGVVFEFETAPAFKIRPVELLPRGDLPDDLASRPWADFTAGDFDGDGCADLIAGYSSGGYGRWRGNCRYRFTGPENVDALPAADNLRIRSIRLIGDRCDDLLLYSEDGVWLFISDCRGGFSPRRAMKTFKPLARTFFAAAIGRTDGGQDYSLLAFARPAEFGVRFAEAVEFTLAKPPPFASASGLTISYFENFAGYGDVDGDGHPERLVIDTLGNQLRLLQRGENATGWGASFSGAHRFDEIHLADFNGDGLDDVLAAGSGIGGWWLAQSTGRTAIESPVKIGIPPSSAAGRTTISDIDADGFQELLWCAIGVPHCLAAEAAPQRPLAGSEIAISSGESVVTDASGRFEIAGPVHGTAAVAREGYRFARAERRFDREHRRLNYIAVSLADLQPEQGRIQHYVEPPDGPKVCTGYLPGAAAGKWSAGFGVCPEGYAWFAVDDSYRGWLGSGNAVGSGNCCPLPHRDILIGPATRHDSLCPEGSVVVGRDRYDAASTALECREINSEKYRLGPAAGGVYFGRGASSRFSGPSVSIVDLPPAIRWGVQRRAYGGFDPDGCIGTPPGSLYVGSGGKGNCSSHLFRRLFRREGNELVPVKMYPDCRRAPDPFDTIAGCDS